MNKRSNFTPDGPNHQSLRLLNPPFTRVGYVTLERRNGDAWTNVPWLVIHHSPTGFEFGYGGSGPADLALNILEGILPLSYPRNVRCYEGFCTAPSWSLHQSFKDEFITKMDRDGGVILLAEIVEWVNHRGLEVDEEILKGIQ